MAGTRARTIRQDVVDALTGATLDRQNGVSDKLVHLDVPRRPESGVRERAFRVYLAVPPARSSLQTADAFVVEFTIEVFYALGPTVEDRMSDDCERIWWTLETLQNSNAGIHISNPSHAGVEEGEHNYVLLISLVIEYRLNSDLVN